MRIRGRGPTPQSVSLAPATLNLTGSVTATGNLTLTVIPAASLAERVERLEQHIGTLNKLHDENKQAIAKEAADWREMVQRLSSKIEQEAAAIRSKLDSMEQTAMLVDTRALPILGLGVVLSSMSDLIARSPISSGLVIAVALTFLAWAWAHFFAAGRAGG
jgi:chromosome condensin MukBEF ATPase and DNA-binding subunit MukB